MYSHKELVPDHGVLSGIPMLKDVDASSCNVISNTFETCTFSVGLPGRAETALVRLEAPRRRGLADVVALQRLARSSPTWSRPRGTLARRQPPTGGRWSKYSVTEFVAETSTLEQVWDMLDEQAQKALVSSVVDALAKLQALGTGTDRVCKVLAKAAPASDDGRGGNVCVGGPELGYFADVKHFLAQVAFAGNPASSDCTFPRRQTACCFGPPSTISS